MATPIVNRDSPRLFVHMDWGTERPLGAAVLYIRRVGEPTEFAVYKPIEERGGELLFQFDDLLFYRQTGVYEGRLMVGGNEYATIRFMYRDGVRVLNIGNPDYV